jgi:hypothetical protein
MRTKTLLVAIAAFAVVAISSKAQNPVYSSNDAGYNTIVFPSSLKLITVPFNIGVSNGGNEIFGTNLPDGTELQFWDPTHGKFVIDFYDTGGGFNPPPYWYMSDDATPTNPPILTPGQGFYIFPPSPVTNTFAGIVPVSVGTTNMMSLPSALVAVGSVIPFNGAVTNTSGINLTQLPDGTQVLLWNETTGKYTIDFYDTGGGFNPPPFWYMSDDSTPTNPPTLTLQQGFFIFPPSPATWSQSLH